MKANRSAVWRGTERDQEGVTTALGAVMLVGLLVVAIAVWQFTFVPEWEEDAEAEHARLVQGQFLALKTGLDDRLQNKTQTPSSFPITMVDSGSSILSFHPELPATFTLQGSGNALALDSSELLIQIQDGRILGSVNEVWTELTSGTTVAGVHDILHLRLRADDPGNDEDGDSISIEVIDANGAFAGRLTLYKDEHPSGYSLDVLVQDAASTVMHDDGESRFQQDLPPFYWVNTLQEDYIFWSVLNAAPKPLTLHLDEDGMEGAFTIQYEAESGDGTVIVGASGLTLTDYEAGFTGGSIRYQGQNEEYPDQELVYEHGAVFLVQPDGASMLIEPDFAAKGLGNPASVEIGLIGVAGPTQSVSTTRPISVSLGATEAVDFTALAPHFDINLTTMFPGQWATFWRDELTAAGWNETTGHFGVSTGEDWAELRLYGQTTAPSSSEKDLSIDLRQATVRASIET